MNITQRVIIGYFIMIAIASWLIFNTVLDEIKPGLSHTTEDALIETAQVFSLVAAQDLKKGNLEHGELAKAFEQTPYLFLNAQIAEHTKNRMSLEVYATDIQGKVIYDSTGQYIGQDFSKWNDVLLTLQGKYGARSSQADPNDLNSRQMYVAAPIKLNNQIVGSLTVSKPNLTLKPILESSKQKISNAGILMLSLALGIGLAIAWRISRSIRLLEHYADAVANNQPAKLPKFRSRELKRLSHSLEHMRQQLDGKAYVEDYIHGLTHELKSPISAIRGAAEIISEHPPAHVLDRFANNIKSQALRLQQLIDKLLQLANLERAPALDYQKISLKKLLEDALVSHRTALDNQSIQIQLPTRSEQIIFIVDPLLSVQAISNIINNAIEFSPQHSQIEVEYQQIEQQHRITITDHGVGIPEYAREFIFSRFYSLPRPNAEKSTGLGLNFVKEIMQQHQGSIQINHPVEGGCSVELMWPIDQKEMLEKFEKKA